VGGDANPLRCREKTRYITTKIDGIEHVLRAQSDTLSIESVEGEKTGDDTNSNKCTGPRKLQSHKRFLNIDARPSFQAHCASLSSALWTGS
jgi:hypothetical protein